jgi:hypothetical protein
MKLNNILKIALIAPFLVACGESDEFDGNAGGVATFSGTIEGVNTRMYDDAWEEDDAIGVSVVTSGSATTGSNVKYVITKDGDVNFSPDSAKITYGDKNSVDFAAYYPYDGNLPKDGIIKFTSAPISDYMFAKGSGNSSKPNVKFQFSHVMSQVALNIKPGTGVDISNLTKISLGNVIQAGTFNTLTGEVALTSGATASSASVSLELSSETSSINLTLNFLPQTLSTLNLELTVGETTYTATLSLPTVDDEQGLLAGRSVRYDITVNKSSLNASNGTIVGWIKDTGSFASGMLGTHMADEAQLYDLALSDGSFISVFNTDNNTVDVSGLTDTQLANVVGIVYWLSTGSEDNAVTPLKDDALLASDHSGCAYGYILALKDMALDEDGDAKPIQWQDRNYYTESVSDAINGMDEKFKPQSENSILISYDRTQDSGETEKLNKALGYNNTKLLRAYNYYCADYSHKVRPIEYLDLFAAKNEAPKGSSGWYLPSPKELVLMLGDNSNIEFYSGKSITNQFDNIQRILEALGENASKMGDWYWSSSECKYTKGVEDEAVINYYAWRVDFNWSNYGYVNDGDRSNYEYVRAVCAF